MSQTRREFVGATVAAVARAGTVAVSVEEQGNQVRLSLPAGLLRIAVALTPAAAFDEIASELEPFVPAVAAGWQELADTPDFVLLRMESADESVLIGKAGNRLEIAVDGPDTRVRVAVPLATVGALLDKLDRDG